MEERLLEGICWVKIVYPDSSIRVFRGTKNIDICNDRGVDSLGFGEILDMSKNKVVYVSPECKVSFHELQPEFERGVDKFASRFI